MRASTTGSEAEDEHITKDNGEETDSVLNEVGSLQMLSWEHIDPLLLASFTETYWKSDCSTIAVGMDLITRCA